MNIELKAKVEKRLRKLSFVFGEITPGELEELRKEDPEIDAFCRNITDYIGASNPYWRVHPLYPSIRCSINGEIEVSGSKFELREYGGILKVFIHGKRSSYGAADLILACFNPCPGKRTSFEIKYLDGDYRNIKPCNLTWVRRIVTNK